MRTKLLRALAAVLITAFAATLHHAQEKAQAVSAPASTCSRENSISIVEQQINLSKTIDNDVRRIAVLLRSADILWPYQQDKARASLTDAFDIAVRDFKQKGEGDTTEGRLHVQGVDQRYTVIAAIAKHDSAWARKLSKQIFDEEAQEANDKANKDAAKDARTGEKLLITALSLLNTDQATALGFARSSLGFPATLNLPSFLYKLSEVNKPVADQFYLEALNAYSRAPMDQFLYLSSYPFAAHREVGEMPAWTYYAVPAALTPNPSLQRSFVQMLMGRARELIQNPASSTSGSRFSDAGQIFMALTRLEPLIVSSLPDLGGAVAELKGNIASLMTQSEQKQTADSLTDPPKRTFDEIIDDADKIANSDRRESTVAIAILNAAESESLEKLEDAATKLDDLALRAKILSYVYFYRSQAAIKQQKIAEARRLAEKVEELDQRAYLFGEIATESLKQVKDPTEARSLLESVLDVTAKAENSEMKVRAMLVVVHLYAAIDPNRAMSVLDDVVKVINRIESINLSGDSVSKRIEGRAFGSYRILRTPGFNPETVFREVGKLDFDGTLYLASNLTDKSLRALLSLALAEQCLKDLPQAKPRQNEPAKPKP